MSFAGDIIGLPKPEWAAYQQDASCCLSRACQLLQKFNSSLRYSLLPPDAQFENLYRIGDSPAAIDLKTERTRLELLNQWGSGSAASAPDVTIACGPDGATLDLTFGAPGTIESYEVQLSATPGGSDFADWFSCTPADLVGGQLLIQNMFGGRVLRIRAVHAGGFVSGWRTLNTVFCAPFVEVPQITQVFGTTPAPSSPPVIDGGVVYPNTRVLYDIDSGLPVVPTFDPVPGTSTHITSDGSTPTIASPTTASNAKLASFGGVYKVVHIDGGGVASPVTAVVVDKAVLIEPGGGGGHLRVFGHGGFVASGCSSTFYHQFPVPAPVNCMTTASEHGDSCIVLCGSLGNCYSMTWAASLASALANPIYVLMGGSRTFWSSASYWDSPPNPKSGPPCPGYDDWGGESHTWGVTMVIFGYSGLVGMPLLTGVDPALDAQLSLSMTQGGTFKGSVTGVLGPSGTLTPLTSAIDAAINSVGKMYPATTADEGVASASLTISRYPI